LSLVTLNNENELILSQPSVYICLTCLQYPTSCIFV